MKGQWAPFQSLLDLVDDEQAIANDMIAEVELAGGGSRSASSAAPFSSTTSR